MNRPSGVAPGVIWLMLAVALMAGFAGLLMRSVLSGGRVSTIQASLSVADALGSGALEGFARATAPRAFSFPRDHGAHPEFRTEWWYYTGNLHTADGRHFGFQLTFFRMALAPGVVERGSDWGTTQAYLAHFAVTDTGGRRFHAFSRSSRGAVLLAGSEAEPYRVWIDDWQVEGAGPSPRGVSMSVMPMRVRAAEADVAIDLMLEATRPVVLQGDRGLSRKGPEPGNASHYYSFTRMAARGVVRIGAERFEVSGLAWMDREWGTSALGKDLAGWDWFALQLADGRDVMFYQLRRKDGTADPWSAGTLVDSQGRTHALAREDVKIEVLGAWTSPASGVRYPAGWRLTMAPDLGLELVPRLANQELLVEPRYWEGAVTVLGSAAGGPVTGQGYVELVGY